MKRFLAAIPSIRRIALTEQSISKTDRHGLVLDVVVKSVLTEFTADTRLLEATEWKLVVESVICVDPDLYVVSTASGY